MFSAKLFPPLCWAPVLGQPSPSPRRRTEIDGGNHHSSTEKQGNKSDFPSCDAIIGSSLVSPVQATPIVCQAAAFLRQRSNNDEDENDDDDDAVWEIAL